MSKPKPPTPTDPVALANASGAANKDAAIASAWLGATNSFDPYGSTTWTASTPSGSGGVPQFSRVTTLSPDQQNLYNKSLGIQTEALDAGTSAVRNAAGVLGSGFSLQGLPNMQGAPNTDWTPNTLDPNAANDVIRSPSGAGPIQSSLGDIGNIQTDVNITGAQGFAPKDYALEGRRVQDAIMARQSEDINAQENAMIARLNAQGLQQGTEAYGAEQAAINRRRNDALNQAILAGGQEQSRLFGLDASANQLQNQALQQQYGQNIGQFGARNQAQNQLYNQQMGQAGLYNQAQGTQFGQNMDLANFYNQAGAQAFGQGQTAAGFNNAAQQQDWTQALQAAQMQNQLRQQAISEQQLQRNQPINEISALLGMGQIQTPQAAPLFGVNMQPADVMGAYGLNAQQQQANYQTKAGMNNAIWGAAGNVLGSAAGAFMPTGG